MNLLREQPALALFLVIGFGYVFGRLRVAGVQLGTSAGALLGGLLLGNWGVHGTSGSQSIGFMLFIYCVGLRAGPQFFGAFRESGFKFAALSLAVAIIGTGCAAFFGNRLGLPPGYSAGLLGGALTSAPTLVAAQDAVRDGVANLPPGMTPETVLQNIAASYAITYVVGMFGLLVVVSVLPRVLGIDLKEEARRVEGLRRESGSERAPTSYAEMPVVRVYQVTREDLVGKPLEGWPLVQRSGCLPLRLKRAGSVEDISPETKLQLGDLVSVLGTRVDQRRAVDHLGSECVDADLLEVASQTRNIMVTGSTKPASVSTAAELGCFIVGLRRAGMQLPLAPDLPLQKGDLVVAAGVPRDLDALAQRLGRSERPADEADLITFAFGIAAGIAVGLITVRVGGIPLGLGAAGGLLLSGLTIGFLRTQNPTFGQLPVGAMTVLIELGLQFFIANIGLEAGGSVIHALRATGIWLPIGAAVVMAAPVLGGFAIGRLVLGFDTVTVLGAITGAMTSTPALDLLNRQADSSLPTVGYAGTYAFGNVLLAIAGSLIMRF